MAEILEEQYYRMSADNLDYITGLANRLCDALQDPSELHKHFQNRNLNSIAESISGFLDLPEFDDAMSVAAAIHGMEEGDYFSDSVLVQQNRHEASSKLSCLFSSVGCLRVESELSIEINKLIEKVGKLFR